MPLALDGPMPRDAPWKRYAGWPTRDMSKYNTLGQSCVAASAEGAAQARQVRSPATRRKAQKLVADRNRGGSCLACHVMGPAGNADLPGNVGPDLSEIGNAGREDEWLFNYVYDGRVYNPETVMPPWGTHGLFNDQEINDIVAFLEDAEVAGASFAAALDDPVQAAAAGREARQSRSDLVNPGMWAVDRAQALWKTNGPSGSSCSTCHTRRADHVQDLGGGDAEVGAAAQQGAGRRGVRVPPRQGDDRRELADAERREPRDVGLSALPCQRRADQGRHHQRRGQGSIRARQGADRSASSASSTSPASTATPQGRPKWIRGQWLGEQKGQYDHFPTWRTSLQAIWDIRKRFQWCQVNIRADDLPPDAKEYGDLEFYLASENAGLKLSVPGIRH